MSLAMGPEALRLAAASQLVPRSLQVGWTSVITLGDVVEEELAEPLCALKGTMSAVPNVS
jgi:hypothetical protein